MLLVSSLKWIRWIKVLKRKSVICAYTVHTLISSVSSLSDSLSKRPSCTNFFTPTWSIIIIKKITVFNNKTIIQKIFTPLELWFDNISLECSDGNLQRIYTPKLSAKIKNCLSDTWLYYMQQNSFNNKGIQFQTKC